ncbi:MAG: hypothetical protein Q7J29_07990 [Stagnimonas sp.]|nr:hypothetical protein [Stagnimonas sp.]
MPANAIKSTQRSTFKLRPKARQIAEQRARLKSISLGEALSDLVEEAEANRPQTRLEFRDGWPVLVAPPGTAKLTMEMVKEMMDEDY